MGPPRCVFELTSRVITLAILSLTVVDATAGDRSWSQYVTMRDGVRLAVDVHLPKGLRDGQRTATILHLSRYYRSVAIRTIWKPFLGFGPYAITERDTRSVMLKAGYSWVDVDVRGSGASFGTQPYPLSTAEIRDGADLIDWIVRQPWSSGVVGATGTSYNGTLAMLQVSHRHPALKAVAPRFSAWDVYEDLLQPGGLRADSLLTAWSRLTIAFDHARLSDVFGWLAKGVASGVRPIDRDTLTRAITEHRANTSLRQLLQSHVYRDDTDPLGLGRTADAGSPHIVVGEQSRVPVFSYAGWFDGALARTQIRQHLASSNPGSRLLVGPWFHAGLFNASPYAAKDRKFDHAAELLRFFDRHLRGIGGVEAQQLPIRYYTMGAERWRSTASWPPPGASSRSFYLSEGRQLLEHAPAVDESEDRYEVDPSFQSGAARWGLIAGSRRQRRYSDRRGVTSRLLNYTTRPLQRALEVTGHPKLEIFMSTTTPDGGVFAYLEDVAPDGRVRYVTEGQLRLLHRARTFVRADGKPMMPGIVEAVAFDLLPTSYVFPSGHSLRIAISGADAGSFATPAFSQPPVYFIHRDARHASRLEIPTYTP